MFLSIYLLLSISLVSTGKAQNETSYSYKLGAKNGPEQWGELDKSWTKCGSGLTQSPIDIPAQKSEVQPSSERLILSYRPAKATMENRGHDIVLKWDEDAGGMKINGTQYNLAQLHWHSPSEHSINGKRYELEMHMLHKTTDNKIAVVGVLYTHGPANPFIAKWESIIKKISKIEGKKEAIGVVNPTDAQGTTTKYYRYIGSLTTPPCSEGVVWTIFDKVSTVSKEQVGLLKQAVKEEFKDTNARPVQKINQRHIGFYQNSET